MVDFSSNLFVPCECGSLVNDTVLQSVLTDDSLKIQYYLVNMVNT